VAPILQKYCMLPQPISGLERPAFSSSKSISLLPQAEVRFEAPGIGIDLGGIAKGFAVDCAIAVLKEQGVPVGLVNAGGDLAAFGGKPAIVHLRDPRDPCKLIGSVAIKNQALASSGLRFDPFRHSEAGISMIVRPETGRAGESDHRSIGAGALLHDCGCAYENRDD
jgi:thiamine biosynthesis lipoprotein